jgi:thiol-disulfide isomerase/thioredoxin
MTTAEFYASLVDGEKTLLHFSAVWCTPCRLMEPSMAAFLGDNPTVNYIKIDIDNEINKDIIGEFAVKSIPTVVSFEGRKKVKTITKAMNRTQLEAMWELYD